MTESQPYYLHISYRFKVPGGVMQIYGISGDQATVSETRFNGQEDTHMVMDIICVEGKWEWEDEHNNPFVEYHSKELADAILDYINKHGIPSRARGIFFNAKENSGEGDFINYDPIIRSFGKVLVHVKDDDWSGDTRVILRNGERYGFLVIGWGSCCGCDALQKCETFAEVDELINRIEGEIRWFSSLAEIKAYIANDNDRSLSFYAHCEEWAEFKRQVLALEE